MRNGFPPSLGGYPAYDVKPSICGCEPARARFIHLLIIPYVWLINGCLAKLRGDKWQQPGRHRAPVFRAGVRNIHNPKVTRSGHGHQGENFSLPVSFKSSHARILSYCDHTTCSASSRWTVVYLPLFPGNLLST